jgi:hypothetical protein
MNPNLFPIMPMTRSKPLRLELLCNFRGRTSRSYKEIFMARYSKKASEKVEKTMRERKKGTLKSGRSGKKVKSRKQAIAIGLSEARRSGAKVPRKKKSSAKKKKSSAKKK